MAETVPGGAYIVNGVWVNAKGEALDADAVKAAKAHLRAQATAKDAAPADVLDDEATDEEFALPSVKDLDDHLQTLDTVEAVKAMQERDDRKSAQAKYEARIEELSAE